jgi:hypothetical protein
MSSKRWPAVLCALTVFVASLGSVHAHVHLCFDGQEPPASIHAADAGEHHDHHDFERDAEHDDLDVDLKGQALLKSFGQDLLAVTTSPLRYPAPPAPLTHTLANSHADGARAPPQYSRPELRGPPRLPS